MGALLVFAKNVNDLLHTALGFQEDESEATLDRLLSAAADENESITFFLCSIDSFTDLGQRKPDALKKAASGLLGVLVEQTPDDVFIDSIGVNEYLLVVPSINHSQAEQFGDELLRRFGAMADSIRTRPKIQITMSVATGAFPHHGKNRVEVVRGLREAMVNAQQRGPNQVCFVEPAALEAQSVELTTTQVEMLNALSEHEGRDVNSIIREAVDDVLVKHAPRPLDEN